MAVARDTGTKGVVDGGYFIFMISVVRLVVDSKFPTESEVGHGCRAISSLKPVKHKRTR